MSQNKRKQLTITMRTLEKPRLKTQPSSKPHHSPRSHPTNLTLPTLYTFSTDHMRTKTQKKHQHQQNNKKAIGKATEGDESQSDKILNQFLINYFKKKNKFVSKVRSTKINVRREPHHPDYLREPARNKKERSQDKPGLVTNSIDAYFDINSIIR